MLGNFSIAARLKLVGVAIAVLSLILVGVSYAMIVNLASAAEDMHSRGMVGSKLLADADNAVWELRFGIANYSGASPENRKKILDGRQGLLSALEESLKKYGDLTSSNLQDSDYKELINAYQKYKAGAPKWFELIDAEKKEEAAEYRAKVTNAAGSAMVKGIKTLVERQLAVNEELAKLSQTSADHARGQLVAVGVISLLLVIVAMWLMASAIANPLSEFTSHIEEVANSSDFTQRIASAGNNEIGHAASAFNKLTAVLQESLRKLLQSVDQVSNAAKMLADASAQVASGSAKQSKATASIATSVEQVTESINSVSSHAQDVLAISSNSAELSQRGQHTIQETVAEVLRIEETIRNSANVIGDLGQKSSNISSVVQVIKDVADQTNLLALNAAIEAARAGEQGRGFAVVADEVRKLAERTTQSTHEITQLIGSIQQSSHVAIDSMNNAVNQVDQGVVMAKQAGEVVDQIKDRASSVTGAVQKIASALTEQSSASNTIAVQIEDVARMTDVNSKATSDMSTAIRNLESLVSEMRSIGGRFRI